MGRAARRQFRCLLRKHLFQPQMAQQDSKLNTGTLPTKKRDMSNIHYNDEIKHHAKETTEMSIID